MNQVGLGKYPPQFVSDETYANEWKYSSLKDPPPKHPLSDQWISCIYRGIVPAKNIFKRDLAINGAVVCRVIFTSSICQVILLDAVLH